MTAAETLPPAERGRMEKQIDTALGPGDTLDEDEKPTVEEAGEDATPAPPVPREPLPLMDLEKGAVGWESATDKMNPRQASSGTMSISTSYHCPGSYIPLHANPMTLSRNWVSWKKWNFMVTLGIISTLR